MAKEITLDEWEAECKRLGLTSESEGQTTRELCERWGCGEESARKRLRFAHKHGFLRRGKKTIEVYNGARQVADCYWFEFEKKRKK